MLAVLQQFGIKEPIDVQRFGEGHINDTHLVMCHDASYIVQRVSSNAFKDVPALMRNIEQVTDFCFNKCLARGGDPQKEVLRLIKTVDGASFYFDGEDYFRAFNFIKGAKSLQAVTNVNQFYQAGLAFGGFIALLADFDASLLTDTIKNFHHTPKRLDAFFEAVERDECSRAKSVANEIEWVKKRVHYAPILTDLLKSGEIPLRVTHNDTKLNNFLICSETEKALAVIDLDTVMKGAICYDFGDAIRSGCNTAAEDETDLTKVNFDVELFKVFAKGFVEATKNVITDAEKANLVNGAIIMTYECGIRFLTDFLNGDKYFKTNRLNHNLDRARTQFKMVEEMEKIKGELEKFVFNLATNA
jgi:hypothetical protein